MPSDKQPACHRGPRPSNQRARPRLSPPTAHALRRQFKLRLPLGLHRTPAIVRDSRGFSPAAAPPPRRLSATLTPVRPPGEDPVSPAELPDTAVAPRFPPGGRQRVSGGCAPPYPAGDASRRRGGLRGSWQLRAASSEFGSARLARAALRRPRPLRGGECVTVGNMFSEVYFLNTSNDYFSFPRLLCMQDVEAAVTSAGLAFRKLGPTSNLLRQEARSRPGSRELEYPGFYCILYF
ncbi:uncharacterized protein LOC116582278 [Mustela erminea]|uniref:uncharacterized protein LOC116582278 n=1 Tax=Mustela erminea TaxID=36723 RepID=UPI001386C756|nr:uncharacterized protein LOC116582278 [Mustela erminea]